MRLTFYVLLLFVLNLSSAAYANSSRCFGQSVDCFDSEAQKWLPFPNADSCVDYPDSNSHNGWKTTAYCAKDGSSPTMCKGKSVDCFDAQSQKWVTFQNANACEDYYDGGWKTRAYCK